MPKTTPQITYDEAASVVAAALEKAREIGSPSSIAVLDNGRELIAFGRMEDALLASAEIAQGKAYTSACLKMPTGELAPLTEPGGPFYGMEHTHRRPMVVFAGGVPIEAGGEVVGAVGVSGGSGDQDAEIAAAGAAALGG
jgi:uncharacterized protein GlcG (DUF336 family)